MTDDEIVSSIDEEIRQSVGYNTNELSEQRKTALEYFYGEPFGNEVEGRSQYVSPDVRDTILWIMPSLMRIFTGGDHIVRFEPQGPEDEQKANQATDYINYVFQRQNDGFLTLHTWFMDALLSKNGFAKVYWEEQEESESEEYEGLTEDEMVQILQDPSIEVVSYEPSEEGIELKIKRKKSDGQCKVVPIPPEEFLVNRYPTAPLSSNRFKCHRRRVTISELKEMGYDTEGIQSDNDQDFNTERTARYSFDETSQGADEPSSDANRYVWLEECYVKIDDDGDGIAEKWTITKVGKKILEKEEGHSCEIVTLTPIPLPHKLYGMSIADLVMDLQLLKSTIFRQILDNMYLANNGRYMALDGMVNIDDLLTSRPGGIVRVKTFDAVKPMQPPMLGAPAFNLLEYVDHIKDVRTGVNRDLQGIDADSINKTATAQTNRLGAAQSRIELIARIFAETGVKDLFYAILECVQKHQKQAKVIRLRNQWVSMDPREWTNKFDLSVSVGLGTGSKESVIGALLETIKFQMAALQMGLPIVQPANVYNTSMELLKAQSIKGGDRFFTDPAQVPPAPPQPDPALVKAQSDAQTKIQLQDMKHQSALEKQAQRQEFDSQKIQFAAERDREKILFEAQQEAEQTKLQGLIDRALEDARASIEREKMALDAMLQGQSQQHASNESDKARTHEAIQAQNDRIANVMSEFTKAMSQVTEQMNRPKKVVRDEKGRVAGVE